MSQTPSRKCIARQSGTPHLEKEEVIPRRRSARLLAKARAEAATANSHSSNRVGNSYSFPAERGTSTLLSPEDSEGEGSAEMSEKNADEKRAKSDDKSYRETFVFDDWSLSRSPSPALTRECCQTMSTCSRVSKEVIVSADENTVETCDPPSMMLRKAQHSPLHEDDKQFWQ